MRDVATWNEIIICFILTQLLLVVTYYNIKSKSRSIWPWFMMLVVCLTYYFDTDYFSYKYDFENGLLIVGSKEPLYIYLAELSGWNYVIWRIIVWGLALMLYYCTSKRLKLNTNITIYVLVFFFVGLFAYGRVNLAMATYFFGFSFFAKPMENKKILSYIIACCIIPLSFFAHRSFLPVVLLTPVMLFQMTKRRFIFIICLIPIVVVAINYVFSSFLSSEIQMDESFQSFQASAERTAGMDSGTGRNWKAMLVYQTRLISFYVPFVYLSWKFFFSRQKYIVGDYILKYFTSIMIIVVLAISILYGLNVGNSEVTGMRYLFMSGIPICLLLSYLYQKNYLSFKELNKLLLLGFVSFEANFIMYLIIHTVLS